MSKTENIESRDESAENSGSSRRQIIKGVSMFAGAAASLGAFAQEPSPATTATPDRSDGGRFLAGHVAIVTGAARGIGRAIAMTLAKAGAAIVAVDIATNLPFLQYDLASYSQLVKTAEQIAALGVRAIPIVADVRDGAQMQGVIDQALGSLGRIDILIANAGVQIYNVPLAQTTEDQWRLILDVNLTGAANSMRAVLPTFIRQRCGNIVAVTSIEGRMGDKNSSSYSASKWGLIGLVKSLALEVGRYGIRVNGVPPATVATALTLNPASYQSTNPQNPTYEGFVQANLAQNALPVPFLQPQDIADAALWIVSPAAHYVTGAAFDIALGRNAHYTA